MLLRALPLLLVAFTSPQASARTPSLPAGFTLDDVDALVRSRSVHSVDELLSALPDSHHKNAVFVYRSGSLQDASPLRPRQLLFGWDGRMLVAAGGGESADQTVEIAAFDASLGRYRYAEVAFDGARGVMTRDPETCGACHGVPARPIWNDYGDWPGVYGDELGDVPPDESAAFRSVIASMQADPRYRHLHLDTYDRDGAVGYMLPDREYGFPTTVMNFALGNTVGIGAAHRLQQAPSYTTLAPLLLGVSRSVTCSGAPLTAMTDAVRTRYESRLAADAEFRLRYGEALPTDASIMVYRLLGVDPVEELDLTHVTAAAEAREGFWNQGAFDLDEIVALLVVQDLIARDDVAKTAFARSGDMASTLAWITATGEARIPLPNYPSVSSIFFDALGRVEDRGAFCEHLAELAARER